MRAPVAVALVLGSLLGPLACAATTTQEPRARLLRVKVRAIDNRGKPIAGALIEAWQSGGGGGPWWTVRRLAVNGGKAVRTAEDGWATLSLSLEPNPPAYRGPRVGVCLTAQANDYLVTRSGRFDAMLSDRFDVVLTLRRLVTVEGRVVDQQGRPVAGATVFHTGNATPRTDVKTDAAGQFRIEGLPEGKSPLFVSHAGYHFHGQLVDLSSGLQELKLLAADQTPAPLHTLPPLHTHDEELEMGRQVIRPLWQAAMKSAEDGGKEWCCERHAKLEPWVAYDYVSTHLSKASKNRFVSWKAPLLYAIDPEETLAVVESLDEAEYMKAFALLGIVRETPGLSQKQKLDLLDRATQHLRATTDPHERVFRLSSVALTLFNLGKVEEARKIVDIVAPAAMQLSPKTSAAACAAAGQAVSLFDLPAGVRLVRSVRGEGGENNAGYCVPVLFHIAYRIAKEQPDEAERIAAEAIAFATRSYPKFFQMQYRCLPTDDDRASQMTCQEVRLIPLCYDLASVDAGRAERLAATIQNPHLRAYAVGIVAKALVATDKARARKLILRAYDILAEADRRTDRRWPRDLCEFSAPIVAAGLLPVAEAIDPRLVGECLWRAVSYRLPRSADDCLVTLQPERNDAALAALVARYDRKLARALLPAVVKTVISAADRTDYSQYSYYRTTALAMIDVNEALNELHARAAAPGADADRCLGDAHILLEMLPVPGPRRWDAYAMNHCGLWNPDNHYQGGGSYFW